METNQVLEKVGSVLNLTGKDLKKFIKEADITDVSEGVYKVMYNTDDIYVASASKDALHNYALQTLLDSSNYIFEVLVDSYKFPFSRDFILNYMEINDVALYDDIREKLEIINEDINYEITLERNESAAKKLNALYLYDKCQKNEISEKEFKKALQEILDKHLQVVEIELENEMRSNPIDYIKKNYDVTEGEILHHLWFSGYYRFLKLKKRNDEIVEDAIKINGLTEVLNLTYLGASDGIEVYVQNNLIDYP